MNIKMLFETVYDSITFIFMYVITPEGKRPLGRPRCRWEDNTELDLREIGIDGPNWIWLAQDRVHWWVFVNTVMIA
jgi:hypothetical protein